MKSKKIVPTGALVIITLLSIGCDNQQNIEAPEDKQSETGAITDSNFTAIKSSMPQVILGIIQKSRISSNSDKGI